MKNEATGPALLSAQTDRRWSRGGDHRTAFFREPLANFLGSRRRGPAGAERLAERAKDLVRMLSDPLHGGGQGVDLRQVRLQQEAMVRCHPTVHRGDAVRAAGLQAPGGVIGQPLGISLPGDERREDRPAADAEDVGDHVRHQRRQSCRGPANSALPLGAAQALRLRSTETSSSCGL